MFKLMDQILLEEKNLAFHDLLLSHPFSSYLHYSDSRDVFT